ncbi:MAG: TetR/AcrR family transcriptional regulator [Oleispira sp.]
MKSFTHTQKDPVPYNALIKIPRQPRSIEMVHCILDAGMEVIRETGLHSMSTNKVADRAGVSIGSLYQYFANRESILAGIIERSLIGIEQLLQSFHTQKIEMPVDQLLRSGLMILLRHYDPYLTVLRPILREAPLLAHNSAAVTMERLLSDLLRNYLLHHSDRYRLAQGYAGMYVAINSLIFMYLKWMVEPSPVITEGQLVDALVSQLMSAIDEVDQIPVKS